MPKFCVKCGKKLKTGAKFCPSCGATLKGKAKQAKETKEVKPFPSPAQPARRPARPHPVAPPPKKGGMGCGLGCGIGCLIIAIVVLIIIAALIGVGYYFFFVRETGKTGGYFDIDEDKVGKMVKCGDSMACLDTNLKKCSRAKGKTEIEGFAEVDFKVLGPSEDSKGSCVVYAEVDELKGSLSQLESLPSFLSDKIMESLSVECLIPEEVYTKGVEKTTEYIADNMFDVCRGKGVDFLSKYGVEEY